MKLKTIFNKILDILLIPLGEELGFFIALCILSGSADLIFWSLGKNPVFGCYMAMHSIVLCYPIVLLSGLINGRAKKLYKVVFLVLGIINLVADASVHSICGWGFTDDAVALIMGTNLQESKEFVKAYINPQMLICIFSMLAISSAFLGYRNKLSSLLPKSFKILCLIGIIGGGIYIFGRQSKNWESVFLYKINTFLEYEPAIPLENYQKDYNINQAENIDNIVLVIGESLSKSHMGSYGYDKQTTPFLDQNSDAVLFNNVVSASTTTIQSFIRFMTLHNQWEPESWYKKPNLIDIFRSAGYRTSWISNQSPTGVYDNQVTEFAKICDTLIWCGEQHLGLAKKDYDEILLPKVHELIGKQPIGNFTIIHLMGSHPDFASRYPEQYKYFNENDYTDYKQEQRLKLSEYDNSVRYNDYIINEIIKYYKGTDTIIIYFSDHAMDLYQSSDNHIGHAKTGDAKSVAAGRDIPFVIFMGKEFRYNHQGVVEKVELSKNDYFSTEDFASRLLDFCGIQIIGE